MFAVRSSGQCSKGLYHPALAPTAYLHPGRARAANGLTQLPPGLRLFDSSPHPPKLFREG